MGLVGEARLGGRAPQEGLLVEGSIWNTWRLPSSSFLVMACFIREL